ncbi:hypothetical protein GAMM_200016 [Gammaproteobacteria bacterium]
MEYREQEDNYIDSGRLPAPISPAVHLEPSNATDAAGSDDKTMLIDTAYTAYKAFTEEFSEGFGTGYKLVAGGYQHASSLISNQQFLTSEQYEQSPYKIEGQAYPKGVSENIAKMRYEEHQETMRRDMILSKLYAQYPKTTMTASFLGGIAGAILDPVFVAAVALCPEVGVAAKTKQIIGLTKWGVRAKKWSVIAAKDISMGVKVGTIGGVEHYAKDKVYGEDVEASEILTSGLYGGLFGMGVTATRGLVSGISGIKGALSKSAEITETPDSIHGRFISPASDFAIKIKAISQLEEGKQVDITPYFKAAASCEKYTTKPLEEIQSLKNEFVKNVDGDYVKNTDNIDNHESLEAIAETQVPYPAFEEFVEVETKTPDIRADLQVEHLRTTQTTPELQEIIKSSNLGTKGFADTLEKLTTAETVDAKMLGKVQELHQEHLEQTAETAIRDYVKNNKKIKATLDNGLQAYLAGITGRGIKARDSVAGYVKARRNDTLLSFWEGLKKRGVADYFASQNPLQEIEIAKALRGEFTNDKSAVQVAETFKPLQEQLRTSINRIGGQVSTKEGYITHFSHDPIKASYTHETAAERLQYRMSNPITSTFGSKALDDLSFARWKNTHLPLLDHEKTFGDMSMQEQDTALRNMFNRIVARERYKDVEFGIAEKWSRSQFFVYKDAASFIKANRIYGHGNIYDAMINTLKGESQTIAIAEKLGLNPKATFENILERLKRTEGITAKSVKKLENPRLRPRPRDIFNNLVGASPYDASSTITNNILTWEYLTKAANVTIASFNDIVHQTAVQQKLFGKSTLGAAFDTLRTQPKEFVRVLSESIGKKVNRNDLSVAAELARVMAHDLHSRYNDAPVNKLARIMNAASGINAWDTASIRNAVMCSARTLFLNSRLQFDKLNVDLKKTLLQYGIESKDWDLIRKNPFKDKNGRGYITVDSSGYSKESIAKYLGKAVDKVEQKDIDEVRKQARFKLLTMNQDVVDYFRLTPDAVERSLPLMRGKDFLTRTFMQFKGYPIALTRRILSLVMENSIEGFREDGFVGLAKGIMKDAPVAASYVGEGLLLGYATNSLLRLTQGKTPLDTGDSTTWFKAAAYSGSGGLYYSALEHLIQPHGTLDTLAGLAGSTWSDINNVGQIITKGVSGKPAAANLYKLISGNLPLINLPYTKEAFNYLIGWRIFETIAPKAFRRMIKKEQGNWIINPKEYLGS